MKKHIGFRSRCRLVAFVLAMGLSFSGTQDCLFAQSPDSGGYSPRAQDLLPCPMSVPCRVTPYGAAEMGVGVRTGEFESTRLSHLLPCPMSVPCIVTGSESLSSKRARPGPRRSSASRELQLRAVAAPPTQATAPPGETAGASAHPQPTADESPASRSNPAGRATVSNPSTTSSAASSPEKPAEIALKGAEDFKDLAERSVRELDQELSQIDPKTLGQEDVQTYSQTKSFSVSAHEAMNQRDYLVALGFSKKATDLLSCLRTQSKPAH